MDAATILKILKILLIVLGGITVVWGIYDMFGDGQQNSSGLKKSIGGIAFAAISAFILTWAEGEIKAAEAAAGISGHVMVMIGRFLGR